MESLCDPQDSMARVGLGAPQKSSDSPISAFFQELPHAFDHCVKAPAVIAQAPSPISQWNRVEPFVD
jgi:hypothetical protein